MFSVKIVLFARPLPSSFSLVVMPLTVIVIAVPGGFSTERSEQFAHDESRTATLDLKSRKHNKTPTGAVPFADVEDDQNLTAVEPDVVIISNGADVRSVVLDLPLKIRMINRTCFANKFPHCFVVMLR